MQLQKGIPVSIGPIHGFVFGGPFRKYVPDTRRLVGVKMAAEIDHPHEISIPTEDFSIPDHKDMEIGIIDALGHMMQGNDIYVGCMGGIGRTGLFMGCLAKVMKDCDAVGIRSEARVDDPVKWVRQHYIPHAIETRDQQDFVRTFDTSMIVDFVQEATRVEVEVKEVPVFPPFWQYMAWWFSGGFMR